MKILINDPLSRKKYLLAIIALLTIPLSGLSVDVYAPSLPAISSYFLTNDALAQLTITFYMLGFGIMLLFSGSISDCIGRKKPFLIAMLIYIFTTALSPSSKNIYELLVLRFIQGTSVAFLSIPMRAIISDLFQGNEFYKMMNYMAIAWSIGPIIAPVIGGYLQHLFGWHASFYFLAGYSSITLIANLVFMPETIKEKQTFEPIKVLINYYKILSHLKYLSGLIILGLLYSMLILFGAVCPFIIENVLHYSPVDFGHFALLIGLSWCLGNFTNHLFSEINAITKIKYCFFLMLINIVISLIVCINIGTNICTMFIMIFIQLYLGGIIFPNYFSRNVLLFPNFAATANALMSAFMLLISVGISSSIILLKLDTQIPLALTYLVLTVTCLLIFHSFESEQKIE